MFENKELIYWFNNYFDNCYNVVHCDFPGSVFMFYDINYVRQKKLAKLDGKEPPIKTDITGECLFQIDLKNSFFRCDYEKIYCYLKNNYNFDFYHYNLFIKDRLKKYPKLTNLLPSNYIQIDDTRLHNYIISKYDFAKTKTEIENEIENFKTKFLIK